MTVWHSSDLGWSAGQDVSSAFASLLSSKKFKAGDTLVLEDTYKISGSHLRLPENFTLTAEKGAGLDVRTTSPTDTSPLFLLSNGVTVDNVTFDVVNAPKTGYSGAKPVSGSDYHTKRILVVEGDGVTVQNSAFSGNVSMHIDVLNGDRFSLDKSSFEGGFYQVRIVGGDDAKVTGSHFRKSLGDGIKTTATPDGDAPERMLVADSFFERNARDGLDTAGGFKDGQVLNSVFYDNGVSGIDIKSLYKSKSDFDASKQNHNIRISGSEFIDSPNGVVVTVLNPNGLLNKSNAHLMPHDIKVSDSIFENNTSQGGRAFLIKDGYDITWEGISLLGKVNEMRFLGAEAPTPPSGTNLGGEIETTGAPRKLSVSELWSGSTGPVAGGESDGGSGGSTAPAPEPEPAPEPAPQPKPAPEEDTSAPAGSGETLFQRSGAMEFDGTAAKVIEVAPSAGTNAQAATVSFAFNADKVSGSQGLVSKDARGTTVNDGHFTSYIKDGTLHVRYQEGSASKTLTMDGIEAHKDYDVRTSFGDGQVSLWVNDVLADSAAFKVDWMDNKEYLQIGANGWASKSGAAGFVDAFDGTISNVGITEGFNTAAAVSGAGGGETGTGSTETDTSTPAAPEGGTGTDTSLPALADVFELDGPMEFNGTDSSVREFAPDQALQAEAGNIAFTFNADTVSGRQGLVSKDAYGADANDGHFTSYISNGKLFVRFQEGAASETFEVAGIEADTDYSVSASFGGGKVALRLNGELAGEADFEFDWLDNAEHLQVGANGWTSKSGEAGFTDAFDGTISDFAIATGSAALSDDFLLL
ncbi:right-handed parallel beta-helix repeat-containing protein [Leisingera aquaemixtae]|uniref:right-handed parallel beta-helix repeat-containing protein n=1 Tax=Leisingera aquaemixtae TaxID=1396826 RepID=UPI0021A3EE9E|nr:right-handed parallel beta-helix repeat-containing protein [Leisingera aquaemixtae]UWQ48123.1 right-handed parallel beta-helix repeat-containing protein [Leisingera aquaemixtae]